MDPFPMQDGPPIPYEEAEGLYACYTELFGKDQTLEQIAQRGGFSHAERSGLPKMLEARRRRRAILLEAQWRDLQRTGRRKEKK